MRNQTELPAPILKESKKTFDYGFNVGKMKTDTARRIMREIIDRMKDHIVLVWFMFVAQAVITSFALLNFTSSALTAPSTSVFCFYVCAAVGSGFGGGVYLFSNTVFLIKYYFKKQPTATDTDQNELTDFESDAWKRFKNLMESFAKVYGVEYAKENLLKIASIMNVTALNTDSSLPGRSLSDVSALAKTLFYTGYIEGWNSGFNDLLNLKKEYVLQKEPIILSVALLFIESTIGLSTVLGFVAVIISESEELSSTTISSVATINATITPRETTTVVLNIICASSTLAGILVLFAIKSFRIWKWVINSRKYQKMMDDFEELLKTSSETEIEKQWVEYWSGPISENWDSVKKISDLNQLCETLMNQHWAHPSSQAH
ncbi:hypothetical protein CAEBREN_01735 [Caenorhabditis brenneri]|uniref:Uncharacterized protein n=1 Tax=Caenorhabditis brenneri TaxID=135651 RepID=G0MRP5_CAEBE|nr:hypothetical protein CAEBREN_01735 [Caenorhabditis brenneri]